MTRFIALAAFCVGCGGQTADNCPSDGSLTVTLQVQSIEVPVCPQSITVSIDNWQVGGSASIEGEVCSNVLQDPETCKVTIDCPGDTDQGFIVADFTATSATGAKSILVQQGGCIYVQ